MPLFRQAGGCAKAGFFCAVLFVGCTTASKQAGTALRSPASQVQFAQCEPAPRAPRVELLAREKNTGRGRNSSPGTASTIEAVNHEELVDTLSLSTTHGDDLFSGRTELALPLLLSEVAQRNPSLKAALAAWGAAAERSPQAVALDDPILQSMFAPVSFSSPTIQSSYIVGVGQKIPWAGKRELRGQVAQWNAVAASLDHDDVHLRLAEAARLAYYDYYNVFRQMELNTASLAAVSSFRDTADSKFKANQVTQQDVLQADVELAKLEQRRLEIEQARQVATARINTLLHRDPALALPPPPPELDLANEIPDVESLRAQALERRPDLAALAARLHAEQNAVALTCKEYYPDFEIMGKYDTFWTDPAQRGQVALNLNIPLNQTRRAAAVREAMFRVNKLQAEYDQQLDLVKNEVQITSARLHASRRALDVYREKILPASRDNVAAATSGYVAGTVDFLRLVQAQRELIELNEKYQQAIVEYNRSRAELDRVVGAR